MRFGLSNCYISTFFSSRFRTSMPPLTIPSSCGPIVCHGNFGVACQSICSINSVLWNAWKAFWWARRALPLRYKQTILAHTRNHHFDSCGWQFSPRCTQFSYKWPFNYLLTPSIYNLLCICTLGRLLFCFHYIWVEVTWLVHRRLCIPNSLIPTELSTYLQDLKRTNKLSTQLV